ncbi:ABC transporter ATP-binding protein, partial [Kutzneria sp. 744]|uniref:ABC transporter ATP-binding protein n=1 Tax=Kutzneria sp. (strain 744) TaxID=345341 RepID=UPI0003EEAF34
MSWGAVGLTVRYGRRTALSDVSLRAEPGMVTCVVGGDGAGKTTLMRALVGSAPVTHGAVVRPSVAEIGYLSAGTGVYPDLTVRENIEFVAQAYRVRDRDQRRLLDRTGLSGVDDRLGAELSGGMRQKLGVVLGLLHRSRLLVLDEPTTGVDPASRADIARLIASAAADGTAVVFTTSYLDEAERAGEVLVLDAGAALAAGVPAKI